ncbi:LemA family protein [uncultured Christiangramia sp.]|uniref:LemA family protein n=1 Tax=Christiangramia sp. 3-2217-3z TaxID=3417564 RepID=UPI0025E403D7|nr:LemA family protein [uncultured Christiangramia sp.]|tara:strand:+ start:1112 stop:1705 length:594 start_codon:yes stop_codon:yes gene_type:complete
MKKWLPIAIIVVLVIVVWQVTAGFNNTAVTKEENAKLAWSNVESSYQRRNDLIGNLVKTVEGAADFERGTLKDVIEARSKATSVNVDAENLSAAQIEQFQQAQQGVTSALSRLLVTVERYPDLKANQNFLQLQSQLEGTENRINVARDRYNAAVTDFNTYIRTFPNTLFAGMFGFEKMERFQADAGAENAPDVEFDF